MRTSRILSGTLVAAVFLAVIILAEEKATTPDQKPATELKHQSVCPVMGNPIDSSAYTDIQGQRVYHCCAGCSKKLKADPDKYFKQTAAEGILFENIQKTCPVSGEELLNHKTFSDFEGRRIYFCCEKCQKTFSRDPQKYLKGMDAPAKTEQPAAKEDHSGHGGH